jgi:hypothetical protein
MRTLLSGNELVTNRLSFMRKHKGVYDRERTFDCCYDLVIKALIAYIRAVPNHARHSLSGNEWICLRRKMP